jgi:hypothetical protein
MVRYLYRNVTPLNLILLVVLILVGFSVLVPLAKLKVQYSPPPAKVKAAEVEEKAAYATGPSPADYALIADQNLFHPERKVSVEKKAELPKPELSLFGTMVADGISYAFVEDKKSPQTSPGRGKRQTVLKKGDTISGFVVTDIASDQIVLVRGEERVTVYLAGGEKRLATAAAPGQAPKAPGHTATQPATPAVPQPPRVVPPPPRSTGTGAAGDAATAATRVQPRVPATDQRRTRSLTGGVR